MEHPDWSGLIQALILFLSAATTLISLYINSRTQHIETRQKLIKDHLDNGSGNGDK